MSQPATTILRHPELASLLSQGDAVALRGLSDVAQAREWTQHTVEKYKDYISALLAIHNTLTPINELPTEILQRVFAFVPSEYAKWCSPAWMVSLQSVCRRWRSVLLATPEYWVQGIWHSMDICNASSSTDADGDEDKDGDSAGIQILELFLARSVSLPLDLRVAYTSRDDCPRWKVLENHFDRVVLLEVVENGPFDLQGYIMDMVATEMKHLEQLELNVEDFDSETSTDDLDQWDAQNLPCLTHLTLPGPLFCCETTVPSLHTVTLTGDREIHLLPSLLDALERCPALTALSLSLASFEHFDHPRQVSKVVELPRLLRLDVAGNTVDIYYFLSSVSFPSYTYINLEVTEIDFGAMTALPILQNAVPRCHSGVYASPSIDRLCLRAGTRHLSHRESPSVSMHGYVQGRERLRVDPVMPKLDPTQGADHVLQFLNDLSACTLTELALDMRHLPSNMDARFWAQCFAALPDLHRLELLSPTVASRATKRIIAEQFLVALRGTQEARRGTCLAWVLRAKTSDASRLEGELSDVEEVLRCHADSGGRLARLELYVVTSHPDSYSRQAVDVAQVATDRAASQLVTTAYISRLEDAADEVAVITR